MKWNNEKKDFVILRLIFHYFAPFSFILIVKLLQRTPPKKYLMFELIALIFHAFIVAVSSEKKTQPCVVLNKHSFVFKSKHEKVQDAHLNHFHVMKLQLVGTYGR